MANYSILDGQITSNIYTNGVQAITGAVLQGVLLDMVTSLGKHYQFSGVALPAGVFTAGDENVAFFAYTAGTYTNYGGFTLNGNSLHVLTYNGSWTDTDTGIPTGAALTAAISVVNASISSLAASVEADYAKKDGTYPLLGAGAADALRGAPVAASFIKRASASPSNGLGLLAALNGNAIVWNQLFANGGSYNGNGITISFDSTTGIYTISGTATNDAIIYLTAVAGWISGTLPANHSGFFSIKKVSGTFSGDSVSDIHPNGNGYPSFRFGSDTEKEVINSYGIDRYPIITIKSGDIFTDYKFRIMCFDLTALFNGAVPKNYTAADFKAVYPLGYYAPTTGKVIPFAAQNLVTTGFNQWDEEMAKGIINSSGEEAAEGNSFHSKNYIPVFPNTDYSLTRDGCDGILYIAEYDANKNFIVRETKTSSTTSFTTGTGTYFIKVSFYKPGSNWGITLPSFNMCINLSWSGYRNGEYEPYEKHTLDVDPASWEDTDGNLIFPYGMVGKGNDCDIAVPESDGLIHEATVVWERRAYAAGDESDASVITDGSTYTYQKKATPEVKTLDTPVPASFIAAAGGTESWEPENGSAPYTAPCNVEIKYPVAADGGIIGAESLKNLLEALKTAGVISAYTMTWDATSGTYQFTVTA